MSRDILTIEQPNTQGVIDVLDTPEHLGAEVTVTVVGGKLRVEIKAFTGSSTWVDHEIEVDLTEKDDESEPPAIDDLPEDEHEPFTEWLSGQTVPVREDGRDAYFPSDYDRWKKGLDVID